MPLTDVERLEWEILRLFNVARDNPQRALDEAGVGHRYDEALYPSRGPLRMNKAFREKEQEWAQLLVDGQGVPGDPHHLVDGRFDAAEGADVFNEQFGEYPSRVRTIIYPPFVGFPDVTIPQQAMRYVNGWLSSDGVHRDIILGNTEDDWEGVLIGLGARKSEDGDAWVSGMITPAPRDGFVDLYIKDNLEDDGLVPSTGVTYASRAIQLRDAMGEPFENPEHGQDNYVYVEVHNAGTKSPDSYRVFLYWADPGTNLAYPDQWHDDGIGTDEGPQNWIDGGGLFREGECTEVGPFMWCPQDPEEAIWDEGHYCLFARVVCDEDPIMHEGEREYENNVAQRNVTVVDEVEGGECSFPIDIRGGSLIDVNIAPGLLIPDGGKVSFRIRSRLLDGVNLQGMDILETTPGGQITTLECSESTGAAIEEISMGAGETSRAELRAKLPDTAEGEPVYPITVSQTIDGRHVGAVTVVARIIGTPAYIGNRNSGELHYPDCYWVGRMASHNKVPFNNIEVAHRRRYDNCAFCLGGSKR
jgi:hypothetical protein